MGMDDEDGPRREEEKTQQQQAGWSRRSGEPASEPVSQSGAGAIQTGTRQTRPTWELSGPAGAEWAPTPTARGADAARAPRDSGSPPRHGRGASDRDRTDWDHRFGVSESSGAVPGDVAGVNVAWARGGGDYHTTGPV